MSKKEGGVVGGDEVCHPTALSVSRSIPVRFLDTFFATTVALKAKIGLCF